MNYPGHLIQRGDTGPEVGEIQRVLGVQQTQLFGPTTEEFVVRFQASHGLQTDGVVGPQTWAMLFRPQPSTTDLGRAALEEARARIGVREHPIGSNAGPEVNQYLASVGLGPGQFWCMAFVFFCVNEAAAKLGLPNPLARTASCSAQARHCKDLGILVTRNPNPGDIFLCLGGSTGYYHTGFVVQQLANERFETIEGNSNDDGSANGYEVAHRASGRRQSSCHYIRL
jgi:hypothetical protein